MGNLVLNKNDKKPLFELSFCSGNGPDQDGVTQAKMLHHQTEVLGKLMDLETGQLFSKTEDSTLPD